MKRFIQEHSFSLNIVILIINIFILLMVLHNISLIEHQVERFSSEIAVYEVSQVLNIEPHWISLIFYLKTNLKERNRTTGEEGSPREDVLQILNKIQRLKIETGDKKRDRFCDLVQFYGLGQRTHYPIYFCYDSKNEQLTNISVNSDQ